MHKKTRACAKQIVQNKPKVVDLQVNMVYYLIIKLLRLRIPKYPEGAFSYELESEKHVHRDP